MAFCFGHMGAPPLCSVIDKEGSAEMCVRESLKGTLIQYSSGRLPQHNRLQRAAALVSGKEELNYTGTSLTADQVMKLKALGQLFSVWLSTAHLLKCLKHGYLTVCSLYITEMLSAAIILLAVTQAE